MKPLNIGHIATLSVSLMVLLTAETYYPIIFIHGIEGADDGHANPNWAWREWNGEKTDPAWLYESAMNKILEEGYGGYTAGSPLDCDMNSSLQATGGETRKIYNFSYYHPNNEAGVISLSEEMLVYVSHGWNQNNDYVLTFWPNPPPWGYDYTRYWPRYLPGIGYLPILAPDGNWYWSLTPIRTWYNSYISSWENGRYAKRLAQFIDKVLTATGASKVEIVAHSMGGLVARAAIKYYGCDTKVRKLLTIGTLNQGWHGVGDSHWMQWVYGHAGWQRLGEDLEMNVDPEIWDIDVCFTDMATSNAGLFVDFLPQPSQTKVATIAGTRAVWYYPYGDDGLILVSDVYLSWAEFNAEVYASHGWGQAGNEEELCLLGCTHTKNVIESWIIDDASVVQPDNQIKPWWDSDYIGDGIYNSTGSGQYVLQFADPNQWAKYHIKIENDGYVSDVIHVKATESGTGTWTTRYFDALSGGNDITSQITSANGWPVTLEPGAYREIRVEVKPGSGMQGLIRRVTITSRSYGASTERIDVVLMDTQCNNVQPDNLIKNRTETTYIGNNIYNTTGQGQTKNQDVPKTGKATYHVKIENDGETWNVVLISGTGGDSYWTAKYYDALTGGTDITQSVVNGDYLLIFLHPGDVEYLRVEVTPKMSTPTNSIKTVSVTSTSGYNANKKDVVKAVTKCIGWGAIVTGPSQGISPEATGYNNARRLVNLNGIRHLAFTSEDAIFHTYLTDTTWSEPVYVGTGKYPALALGPDGKIYCIYNFHGYKKFWGQVYYVEYLLASVYDGFVWSEPQILFHTYGTFLWGVGAPSLAIKDTMAYVTFKSYHGPGYNPPPGAVPPHIVVVEGPAVLYGKFPLGNPQAFTCEIIDTIIKTPVEVDTAVYLDSLVPLLISPSVTIDLAGVPHILWEGDSMQMRYYTITDSTITKELFDSAVDFPSLTMNGDQIQLFYTVRDSIRFRYGWTGTTNLSQTQTVASCESPISSGQYLTWTKNDGLMSHLYYGAIPASGEINPIEINYSTDLITYPQIHFNTKPPSLDLVWTEYSEWDSIGYIFYLNLPIEEVAPTYAFDMGQETPVPICVQRDGFMTLGPNDTMTLDYDSTELIYRLTLHSPHTEYLIRWVWYHEEANKIKLQLSVDDILHRNRWVNPFEKVIEEAYLPDATVQDNVITIRIKVLNGTIAVLSGLEIEMEQVGGGGPQGEEALCPSLYALRLLPNPFREKIKIRFMIQDSRYPIQKFSLKIYDITGRLVRDLSQNLASCIMNHESILNWNGEDDLGRKVPAGVYFIRMLVDPAGETAGYQRTEKVILLR